MTGFIHNMKDIRILKNIIMIKYNKKLELSEYNKIVLYSNLTCL